MKQHHLLKPLVAVMATAAIGLTPLLPGAWAQEASDTTASTEYFEITVSSDANAKAWVQKNVTSKGELKLRGEGWKNSAGDGGARVTVKLQTGPGEFIPRTDNIQQHPTSGQDDATIWAYITPDASGKFNETLELPDNLTAGQRLQVSLATGFGDPERSVVSPSLFVDGEQWQAAAGETIECTPTSEKAEIEVTEGPDAQNRIKIEGRGFCNNSNGASVVALKLGARGMYSRIDDEDDISDNLSIWVVLRDEVDQTTGNFEYWFTLPDGTTEKPNGSVPAFTEGEQTIIALTGSLKDDDPIRSVNTKFDYGEYQPAAGAPEPPAYDALDDGAKKDMQVHIDGDNAIVTLPHSSEGDFVFFSYFLTDTSQRLPWSDWYLVDNNKQVQLDLSGITRNGSYKLVAQNGNRGVVGDVVGWEWIEISTRGSNEPDTSAAGSGVATPSESTYGVNNANGVAIPTGAITRSAAQGEDVVVVRQPDTETVTTTTARSAASASNSGNSNRSSSTPARASDPSNASKPRPDFEPEAPVDKAWRLTENNAGDVTGSADGESLIITVPESEEGDWYYIWAYTPDPKKAGWLQTDADNTVRIDVSGLSDGEYKFAVVDDASEMVGWTGITLASESEDTSRSSGTSSAASDEESGMSARDWWLIGGALGIVALGVVGAVLHQRKQQKQITANHIGEGP